MAVMNQTLATALSEAAKKAFGLDLTPEEITIEIPKRKEQGEYSTNLAMKLARTLHRKPADIAKDLVDAIDDPSIEKAEIAGPGFINFTMASDEYSRIIPEILEKGSDFGQLPDKGIKVNLEYVSANPTGPLHLGHARGAAWGDAASRIMKKAG